LGVIICETIPCCTGYDARKSSGKTPCRSRSMHRIWLRPNAQAHKQNNPKQINKKAPADPPCVRAVRACATGVAGAAAAAHSLEIRGHHPPHFEKDHSRGIDVRFRRDDALV
jgi:hypothetical protein